MVFGSTPSFAGDICFCHKFRQTVCTSDPGQQEGHTSHGDPRFGCDCGDGICDPNTGETSGTCPQDCGSPQTCGDDNIDEGEVCGEPQLPECLEGQTCEGCLCTPPILCVSDSECPDDGDPCNGAELCVPVLGCVSDEIVSCDSDEVCIPGEGCVFSDVASAVSGSGNCSLNHSIPAGKTQGWGMLWIAGGLLSFFILKSVRAGSSKT